SSKCSDWRSRRRMIKTARIFSCMSPIALSWRKVSRPAVNASVMMTMMKTINAMATSNSTIVKPCRRRMSNPLWAVITTHSSQAAQGKRVLVPRANSGPHGWFVEHLGHVIDHHGLRAIDSAPHRLLQFEVHRVGAVGARVDDVHDPVEVAVRLRHQGGIENPTPAADARLIHSRGPLDGGEVLAVKERRGRVGDGRAEVRLPARDQVGVELEGAVAVDDHLQVEQ